MTDELKPCPFCHKEQPKIDDLDYYGIIRGDKDEDDGWSAQYECPYCCAMGPYVKGFSEEDSAIDVAIEAWNSRVEPDTLPQWAIGPFYNDIQIGYEKALEYILSLRKPEEK